MENNFSAENSLRLIAETIERSRRTIAKNSGKPLILWSVDTRDWETKDSESTINNVLNDVQDGSIVLMHDIYESTMIASETIIPELQNMGYQLVTVEEMGLLRRGGLKPGTAYYSIKPET